MPSEPARIDRAVPQQLAAVAYKAHEYATAAVAESTRRAYRADWAIFEAWCQEHGLRPMPASGQVVALYLSAHAEQLKVSTLERRLATLCQAHRARGHRSPAKCSEVLAVLAGIRREHGVARAAKAPVRISDLRQILQHLPDTLRGTRDRALLLVGFAGALRRSELVALDVMDLEPSGHGVAVTLRRSKTDQQGKQRKVGLPHGKHPETCPVRALDAWLAAAEIKQGPVFRSVNRHGQVSERRLTPQSVALVVKRAVAAVGLSPADFSGHSLRAGLASSAAEAGASERSIMRQTGHRSVATVRRYIRDGSLYRDNAAAKAGL